MPHHDGANESNVNLPRKERNGLAFRFLDGIRKKKKRIQDHPVQNAIYSVVVGLAVFGASEAYQFAKESYRGKDPYIEKLSADQAAGFKDLKEGLAALRGVVGSSDRGLLSNVDKTVRKINEVQQGMLHQLALAQKENATLSAALKSQGRVQGGYDFMLSEGSGIALSKDTFLGVSDIIYGKRVVMNLTAPGEGDLNRKDLVSGQSLPFRNEKGQACKVALLSVDEDAASFKVGCS